MPFTPQYDYPVVSSADIGYTISKTTFVGFSNEPAKTIAYIDLPSAGVWLVEGQLQCNVSNPAYYMNWSLSLTTDTMDISRMQYIWLDNVNGSKSNNHMTSVFSITGPKTIYMVASFRIGISDPADQFLTYTRLA